MPVTIFWFRRDLRLLDNAGLYHALQSGNSVLPIFIFDENILHQLDNKQDKRVDFIYQSLEKIQSELHSLGSSLLVFYGTPIEIWKQLLENQVITQVFCNHDYEKYALERDETIKKLLEAKNIPFYSFKDQCIFEKNEILSANQTPYTIFTPYSRKWKEKINAFYLKSYPTENYFSNFQKHQKYTIPSLESIGFQKTGTIFPSMRIDETILKEYHEKRNFPAIEGTTRLSVHLRFGTLSIRTLAQNKTSEQWLNELIWRDFYMNILWNFPYISEGKSFKKEYDQILWRHSEEDFQAWCEGKTGYPIVDAGMRQLNATGFMHNRVRMIVASFFCKHLLLDWRLGEAYFAKKLLDFDFSANNGGWQWASGSGCDAVPYFRIFNPTLQTQKFDLDLVYIKRWIPEFTTLDYPNPIVDHSFARLRALSVYKNGLG